MCDNAVHGQLSQGCHLPSQAEHSLVLQLLQNGAALPLEGLQAAGAQDGAADGDGGVPQGLTEGTEPLHVGAWVKHNKQLRKLGLNPREG